MDETGVRIVEAAGESKGLEAGVCIVGYISECVVIDAFDDLPSRAVDDQSGTAQWIRKDAVDDARLDHVVRGIARHPIYELADDFVGSIELRNHICTVLQKPSDQRAVDLFADAVTLSVDDISDGGAVR